MQTESSARLSLGRRLAFSALTTVALIATAEVAGRMLLAPPAPISQFVEVAPFVPEPADPDMLMTHPGLIAAGGWDVLRPQRFARHAAEGVVRVLLVGGSSVFQLQENLPEMRRELAASLSVPEAQVEIVNGGGNAQGSSGVRHVVEFMLDKDVDAVVVYSAHNEYTQHLIRATEPDTWLGRASRRSAIVRGMQLLSDAVRLRALTAERAGAERQIEVIKADGTKALVSTGHRALVPEVLGEAGRQKGAPDVVAAQYQENLTAVVDEAREHGIKVVIATVPSNLLAPAWQEVADATIARFEELRKAGDLAGAAALADVELSRTVHLQSTHVENGIIRQLAAERQVPLADVQAAVIAASPHGVPGETLFLDHCHLDAAGRQIWVQTVVPVLAQALESQ